MTTAKQYDYLNRLTGIASYGTGVQPVSFAHAHNAANQRTRATQADGEEPDVTPLVTGLDHYTFDVYPTKHRLRITANWLDCQNDAFFLRPEFIVGQHVTFRGVWDKTPPALVEYLTTQKWTFGGNFYNDGTNEVPGVSFPTCSVHYFRDENMLRNDPTTAWWVSGSHPFPSAYHVTLDKGLTFANGQQVALNESGSFQMYRPQATISPWTTSVNIIGDYLRFAEPLRNGITISNTVSVPSTFLAGSTIKWAQVVTSTLTRVEDGTTHHDHVPIGPALWGDLPTPYEAHDFYGNPVDSPGRYLLPGYNRIVGSGTYQMWMMFEPTYGVWVPLRIVEWSWSGSATNSPAGWGLESGTNSVNSNTETESYPLWRSDVRIREWRPPL